VSRFNPHHDPDDVKNISPGDSVIDSITYIFDVVKGVLKIFFKKCKHLISNPYLIDRKGGTPMNDAEIIMLYLSRSETAITESKKHYGRLIQHIIRNILKNQQDVEECENDTYLSAWQSIPPNQPKSLKAYLSVIARNAACKRCEYLTAEKRNPEMLISLDELGDSVADDSGQDFTDDTLKEIINSFLATLKKDQRRVFLLRYWKFCSVQEIMNETGFSKSKVESMLFRTRNKLKKYLTERGYSS